MDVWSRLTHGLKKGDTLILTSLINTPTRYQRSTRSHSSPSAIQNVHSGAVSVLLDRPVSIGYRWLYFNALGCSLRPLWFNAGGAGRLSRRNLNWCQELAVRLCRRNKQKDRHCEFIACCGYDTKPWCCVSRRVWRGAITARFGTTVGRTPSIQAVCAHCAHLAREAPATTPIMVESTIRPSHLPRARHGLFALFLLQMWNCVDSVVGKLVWSNLAEISKMYDPRNIGTGSQSQLRTSLKVLSEQRSLLSVHGSCCGNE